MNLFQVTKKQPSGGLTLKTASGDIASFEVGYSELLPDPFSDLNVKSNINPVQDLHGEDRPYPAGGGVNLWDEEWEQGAYDENGEKTNWVNAIRSKGYIGVTPSSTIYVHFGTSARFFYYWYASDKQFVSRNAINSSGVITVPNNAYFMTFGTNNDYGTAYHNDISINNPSTDHDYHPYANICPINGYTEANITRCGVNFFDEVMESGSIDNTTGQNETYGTNRMRSINYIPVIASEEYCVFNNSGISLIFYFYASDKSYLSYRFIGNNTTTLLTLPNNCSFVRFRTDNNYGTTYNNDIAILYPSTETQYAPFNGQTYAIAFGQTVYGGVLDVTRGKLHVDSAIADFGDLSITYQSSYPRFRCSMPNNYRLPVTASDRLDIICSCYVPDMGAISGSVNYVIAGYYGDNNLYVSNSDYTDADLFKTAMTGQKIVYKLQNPFDIDLTPVQIEALLGVNNVFSDTNGTTEVKYLDVV